MLEIGTTFEYSWSVGDSFDDDVEYEEYDEEVTVMGYVYYDGDLYYTCSGSSGTEVDVYCRTAEDCA